MRANRPVASAPQMRPMAKHAFARDRVGILPRGQHMLSPLRAADLPERFNTEPTHHVVFARRSFGQEWDGAFVKALDNHVAEVAGVADALGRGHLTVLVWVADRCA